MFRKTRLKLALWNALVVFVVLVVIGLVFLGDLQHRLYNNLDQQTLNQIAPALQLIKDGGMPPALFAGSGRGNMLGRGLHAPLGLILWSADGTPISTLTDIASVAQEATMANLVKTQSSGFITTVGGQQVRVLNIPLRVQTTAGPHTVTLSVLRNTEDIAGVLHESLLVVALTVLMGVLFAVLAGSFLANLALVPIRKAWAKQVQFVADASHELRTPMLTISANAELLLYDPEATVAAKAAIVSGILSETRRLNRLIAHLLTLARSDSHLSELEKKSVNLTLLLEEVIEQFRPLCELKDMALLLDIPPDIRAELDEERVRQLLLILLDNSLKFTDPGGSIRVVGKLRGRKVEISVSDSGCGISPEQLPHIFERFYRGDQSRSQAPGSAGLGLSIAWWIVHAHGGTIDVDSAVGDGTTMTIKLPL